MLEAVTRWFGAQVEIRWHAYELRPAPVPLPDPDSDYIGEHWQNRVLPMAAERGLTMKVPRRAIRSRPALQATLFARGQDDPQRFEAFHSRVFRARFEDDADISDVAVLVELGRASGFDPDALAYAVKSGAHLEELENDLAIAQAIGVNGVPAALVGPEVAELAEFVSDAEPVIGAVPEEWMVGAVERALSGDRGHARLRRRFRPDIKIE